METTDTQQPAASDPTPPPLPSLERNIALALSGGGYRAAAFHLGLLDLLERVGLLGRVSSISTISGGTITGTCYAASLLRGETFVSFYERLYGALRDVNVVDQALRGVQDDHTSESGGRSVPSLIRAAARVYANEAFVGDATLGAVQALGTGPSEWVFSATELTSGTAFRFQTSSRTTVRIGGGAADLGLTVSQEIGDEIRLADVIAASSCFPGAFEPMGFPDDFVWPRPLADVKQDVGESFPVGLMDGGVFDNQGIDGLLRVYDRTTLRSEPGLFLVSDTARNRVPMLEHERPVAQSKRSVRRLGMWVVGVLALLVGLAVAGVIWPLVAQVALAVVAAGLVVTAIAGSLNAVRWAEARVPSWLQEVEGETGRPVWRRILMLGWSDLVAMLEVRARSVFVLLSDVSGKRVRGLIQASLFTGGRYRAVHADALIYGLTEAGSTTAGPHAPPSHSVRRLSADATEVPTTLWFDDEEDLRTLIACGLATACYTLLEYISRWKGPTGPEAELYARLMTLWDTMQSDARAHLRIVAHSPSDTST